MQNKMVIMRGLPGSGKSTLAKKIRDEYRLEYCHGDGPKPPVILTSDDYFTVEGVYYFDMNKLYQAHQWNQWRAQQLIKAGRNVIVDNTNTTWKEIKPYAELAFEANYIVEIAQPETKWAFNVQGCYEHGTHGVPKETLEKMLARFENKEEIEKKLKSYE